MKFEIRKNYSTLGKFDPAEHSDKTLGAFIRVLLSDVHEGEYDKSLTLTAIIPEEGES